ncbi:unnamed protein product [Chondrus crispus]|uniref:Uncharacterized protein n=1 Tax=Chondrus crispus TaxID=2769 RepID=R7QKW3_CHOCR|nr:unnamed protein product [Chondrus crispus]CDF38724.1 unnamed protein product [Chondrus crispus]|eukprot:XP_005718629.1 unnamed protein product [Chondrus crispus]
MAATFQDLPDVAMHLIAQYALGMSEHGILKPDIAAQRTAVSLSRTCKRLRVATAHAVKELHYGTCEGMWPSVRVISPYIWENLRVMDCTVNRSGLLGFLKWLMPGTGITCFRLRVVGDPYPEARLLQLERVLLGRLFTQCGHRLVELEITGINCQALLFSVLFQCTSLRDFRISDYGEESSSTLLSMVMLLCLANRKSLQSIEFPFQIWRDRMDKVPNGSVLYAACEVTWATLWGSYRAGLKESAVNLPSDETELIASFKKVSLRMDDLEISMKRNLGDFKTLAPFIEAGDIPDVVLWRLMPKLLQVNSRPVSKSGDGR